MSVLSDLQWFREVLALGTQARSCYHDMTVRESVASVSAELSFCELGGGGDCLLRCAGQLWSWPDYGGMEM